jgi:hypothetical protein
MQGESGVEINLNAQDAVLHGELSLAEEQDEQGYSIGGWQAGNKAIWNVTVEESGCYDFYVDYSAPFETFAEEGAIEISGVGLEERLFFDLMPTNGSVGGNAQLVDYEEYPANYLHLEQGEYQISVCPSRDEALSDNGDGYNNFLKLRGVRLVKAD